MPRQLVLPVLDLRPLLSCWRSHGWFPGQTLSTQTTEFDDAITLLLPSFPSLQLATLRSWAFCALAQISRFRNCRMGRRLRHPSIEICRLANPSRGGGLGRAEWLLRLFGGTRVGGLNGRSGWRKGCELLVQFARVERG
jgi:hypothetical protein